MRITIYRYTIDSICAEHIYDWSYHPSDKEIYTGTKCCERLSSNNYKLCTYKGNRILYHSLGRNIGFACNLLNDVTSNCKSRNSPLFLATLDAEKCFDSICHVSLFLKLIDVLPTYQWLLLYSWYRKLNAVVKWNGCYSKMFDITRGTRQGSKLSPYLFNIFINQLLLD